MQNSFLDGKGLSHSGKYATTGHAATSRKKTPNALSKIRICARIVRRVVNVTRARATRDRMSVTHFCSGRRDNTPQPHHTPTPATHTTALAAKHTTCFEAHGILRREVVCARSPYFPPNIKTSHTNSHAHGNHANAERARRGDVWVAGAGVWWVGGCCPSGRRPGICKNTSKL